MSTYTHAESCKLLLINTKTMQKTAEWEQDQRPLIVKSQALITSIKLAQTTHNENLMNKSANKNKTFMTALQQIINPLLLEMQQDQLKRMLVELSAANEQDKKDRIRAFQIQNWKKEWEDKFNEISRATREQRILFKLYGQTVNFEKTLKSELSEIEDDDENGLKNIFTSYLADFFAFLSIPLIDK